MTVKRKRPCKNEAISAEPILKRHKHECEQVAKTNSIDGTKQINVSATKIENTELGDKNWISDSSTVTILDDISIKPNDSKERDSTTRITRSSVLCPQLCIKNYALIHSVEESVATDTNNTSQTLLERKRNAESFAGFDTNSMTKSQAIVSLIEKGLLLFNFAATFCKAVKN